MSVAPRTSPAGRDRRTTRTDPPSSTVLALLPETNVESSRWNALGPVGTAATVTFSFMERLPSYETATETPGFRAFTSRERVYTRQALQAWSAVCGLSFIEVADTGAGGDIRFGFHNFNGGGNQGFAGYGSYPLRSAFQEEASAGDIFLNTAVSQNLAPGQSGFETLLHEIGHAIGLKHPFEGANVLSAGQDSRTNTLMSYNHAATNARSPRPYDVAAVQYLYGTRDAANASDARYQWDATARRLTITGGAGDNALYGSGQRDVVNGGAGNDILIGGAGNDHLAGGTGNDSLVGGSGTDTLAGGRGIDTVVGGPGNDTFTGTGDGDSLDGAWGFTNYLGSGYDIVTYSGLTGALTVRLAGTTQTASFAGGTGLDRLNSIDEIRATSLGDTIALDFSQNVKAGAGDDTINAGWRNNTIDGGEGTDTVIFHNSRSSYTVTTAGVVTTVSANGGDTYGGVDRLVNVERLRFSNGETVTLTRTRLSSRAETLIGLIGQEAAARPLAAPATPAGPSGRGLPGLLAFSG